MVAKASQLLQITEEESLLAEVYAQSASQDKKVAADFAVQRNAACRADKPASFIKHLLAIPKAPVAEVADSPRLDVQARDIDFS